MPRVRWGISGRDVKDFDRSRQFAPYMGPQPPNSVFQFRVKVLKYAAATSDKLEQLRIGLELVPRKDRKDERRFKGYFVMLYRSLGDTNQFTYVPFFDAIGASASDVDQGPITDEEGNIRRIGRWRNDGNVMILGQLSDRTDDKGVARKDISWFGPLDADTASPDYDEDEDEASDWDDEEEEEPVRKTRRRSSSRSRRARVRSTDDEDEF